MVGSSGHGCPAQPVETHAGRVDQDPRLEQPDMTRIPIPFEGAPFDGQQVLDLGAAGRRNSRALSIKRVVDVAASLVGLLVLTPLFGLIALLITLDSPGGVFYRQPRLGRDGKAFDMMKFRTMERNAEQALDAELRLDPKRRSEWEDFQKLRHDPRVTHAGRVLRRLDLDELPQLWNVLKGEMSLIGPRPILLNQRELYGRSYAEYVRVLPGITGLWQVSGRNSTTF